ncbi:hypothetical protein AKL15_11775 [Corynebacterium glutamicum]|nr:hypothetical protein AUO96_11755 [Corynebacterium glutamicum]QDX76357.1 hypothetical protein AKL15_11775 [Corynebacterium glutamicum]QDX79134.1 hypothetical protein AKL16_11780 [Corynebacterium glutamicum]TWS33166.1 hypothetical protein AKJ19_10130 [Corynebacterium glutamicum]TWS33243.1 hypothetical protein AKJ20_10115 [Corynebacterium glutamicum]
MSSFWVNVVANTVAGVVGGVASGLIIAITLWWINHLNRPKFQYFDIGNGLGHFHYNRYRPVIVGGTFELGHGPAMIEQNMRAGMGGFYMAPMSNQVFSTSTNQYGLQVGGGFIMSYHYVPIWFWWSKTYRDQSYTIEKDPMDVFEAQRELIKAKEQNRKPDPTQKALAKKWKLTQKRWSQVQR